MRDLIAQISAVMLYEQPFKLEDMIFPQHACELLLKFWIVQHPVQEHPLTLMRTRILADRARRMGYMEEARTFENAWANAAETMKIREDYCGFYNREFLSDIWETLEDMLTEAAPINLAQRHPSGTGAQEGSHSPIELINRAWQKFLDEPEDYVSWEKRTVADYLAG